ncbi:hypothetical protein Dsin_024088 [Dipteronia sinensis]|uniref:DUF4220 domain-containing protein n=1 Tax=Dipteronia sinensis TaxID=43782 RepID=A0AAE0A4V8_9ROSI|nr:hypothetical protein Dsin_024088 [Dipteronia sinensis]
MQLFPEKIIKLWNGWEVRVLIQLSLVLQIILTIFGAQRKYTARIWIRILVWSAYLTADWVATVVLGNLASSQEDSGEDTSPKSNNFLQTFWAPFLLLHLGGPDMITAYSLEDNELWLRHFLGLIVQVGLAFYVFLRSWNNTALTYITIPIFVTGIIKYGERTFVLRSSSSQYFKDLLLSDPDPGPDFIKIQQEIQIQRAGLSSLLCCCCRKKDHDQDIEIDPPQRLQVQNRKEATVLPPETLETGANYLQVAYFLFKRFRYLFADLILSYKEREDSYFKIENGSAKDAFKLVAVELGLMYDELYTKATIVYTLFGILFRLISFCCIVSALISFWIVIDIHLYPLIDIVITYVLMIGAVVLEIYAFIILLLSDWTKLCLIQLRDECCRCRSILADRKRWSESMGQYNLISCCLQNVQPICNVIEKLPWIGKLLDKYMYSTRKDVNAHLQNIIFRQLLEKSNEIKDDRFTVESCKKLLAHRGGYVLQKRYGTIHDEFRWSISDVEFDHSLLLWHIATDLCYYSENNDDDQLDPNYGISKYLSDYMLYLLVFCPSMLPEGIAEIRYRDTLAECMRFFPQEKMFLNLCWTRKQSIDKSEACKALLQVTFGIEEEQIKGDRSQSVLFYGCRLAKQLQDLELKNGWNREQKWEMISEVWVEMLVYAANKCTWKEHGQHLRKGGELLTHVRLLMVHLGLSEQYRIQKRFFTQPWDIQRKFNGVVIYAVIFVVRNLFCKSCLNCCSCCTNCRSRRGIRA